MQDTQETRKDQQPEAAPAPRPEEPRFNTFEIGRELDELLRQRRRARGQDVEPEPPAATPDPAFAVSGVFSGSGYGRRRTRLVCGANYRRLA